MSRSLIVVTLLFGLFAPLATAVPINPLAPNDDRMNATFVVAPTSFFGSTLAATIEPGESAMPCGPTLGTVWFRYFARENETIVFDTFGSGTDTLLAVYEGASPLAASCSDDAGGTFNSEVVVEGIAGRLYDIQVGLFGQTARGSFVFNVAVRNHTGGNGTSSVDLVVQNVSVPAVVGNGTTVTVSADFGNAGTATGPSPFILDFRLDGVSFERQSWPSGIPGGWMGTSTSSVFVSGEGAHNLTVVIDADGQMVESNESNNARTAPFVAKPGGGNETAADVAVLGLLAPANATEGRTFTIQARIGNVGAATTPRSVALEVRVDGGLVYRTTFGPGMPVGYQTTRFVPVDISTPGPHVITATIDADGVLTEPDEANNAASRYIDVLPAPHLSVWILSLDRVPLRTEAGDVRHPLARWEARIAVCNSGPFAGHDAQTTISVVPGNGRSNGAGASAGSSSFVAFLEDPVVEVGPCNEHLVRFDSPGVVGDFRVVADLFSPEDFSYEDNHASRAGFNVVGDEGGVAVPGGARPA